ncbi:hypothetical protein [Bacillus cereus group sp. MYBK57-1]|uniref:hypothetical protein n=1 Tax=Bacillus cereus group sp. MYBK57-1 TaxID=3450619 RepID=UPI003F7997BB
MFKFPLTGNDSARLNNNRAEVYTKITILEEGKLNIQTSFHPKSDVPLKTRIIVFLTDSKKNILYFSDHYITPKKIFHRNMYVEEVWNENIHKEKLEKINSYAIYHNDEIVLSSIDNNLDEWMKIITPLIQTFHGDDTIEF